MWGLTSQIRGVNIVDLLPDCQLNFCGAWGVNKVPSTAAFFAILAKCFLRSYQAMNGMTLNKLHIGKSRKK